MPQYLELEILYCSGSAALTEELASSGVAVAKVGEKNNKLICQPRNGVWVFNVFKKKFSELLGINYLKLIIPTFLALAYDCSASCKGHSSLLNCKKKIAKRGENNLTSIRLDSHKLSQIFYFFKIQETTGLWRR